MGRCEVTKRKRAVSAALRIVRLEDTLIRGSPAVRNIGINGFRATVAAFAGFLFGVVQLGKTPDFTKQFCAAEGNRLKRRDGENLCGRSGCFDDEGERCAVFAGAGLDGNIGGVNVHQYAVFFDQAVLDGEFGEFRRCGGNKGESQRIGLIGF